MPEEVVQRRPVPKHHARPHLSRHARGSSTRLPRTKSHLLMETMAPGSPRRGPRGFSAPKKSVIQLERESDSDDFEDTDSEEAESKKLDIDAHLEVGIHPVEPTPPKLSEETVVTVTSVADMASALKSARRGFVEDADLVSNAVSRSQSSADLSRIVGVSNRTQRRQLLKQRQPYDTPQHQGPTPPGGESTYREFEKIFRVYTNTRAIKNFVLSSFYRVTVQRPIATKTRPLPQRRISSLSATTVNQMSDLSLSKRGQLEGVSYVSNYVLQTIWDHGWRDPDGSSPEVVADETTPNPAEPPETLQTKAQRAHQRIKLPRRPSAIKLV